MKVGAKKFVATVALMATGFATVPTASALTWEDIVKYLGGGSGTTKEKVVDKNSSTSLGNGEISRMLEGLREAVPQQSADSVITEADYLLDEGEDVPKYVRKDYDRGGWKSIKTAGFDWGDIPDSCNTRKASIIVHGDNVKYENKGCKITEGEWYDRYGSDTTYTPANIDKMDVDHIVALGAVHVSGGWRLSDEDKFKIANDPENLVPVSQSLNRQKSDQNADTWLPTGDYLCDYVSKQVIIKDKYDLSVTGAEKARLGEELKKCKL